MFIASERPRLSFAFRASASASRAKKMDDLLSVEESVTLRRLQMRNFAVSEVALLTNARSESFCACEEIVPKRQMRRKAEVIRERCGTKKFLQRKMQRGKSRVTGGGFGLNESKHIRRKTQWNDDEFHSGVQ